MERKIAKKKLSQNFSGRLTPKIGRVTSFSRKATVAASGQNQFFGGKIAGYLRIINFDHGETHFFRFWARHDGPSMPTTPNEPGAQNLQHRRYVFWATKCSNRPVVNYWLTVDSHKRIATTV